MIRASARRLFFVHYFQKKSSFILVFFSFIDFLVNVRLYNEAIKNKTPTPAFRRRCSLIVFGISWSV
jgi:hypothetical protein